MNPIFLQSIKNNPSCQTKQLFYLLSWRPSFASQYLARYICLLRLPFAGNKHVKIRPSYHERIREITRVIGRGDVTITAYVDKVLKAHLDDNRETIERLFEEREAVASLQPKAEER